MALIHFGGGSSAVVDESATELTRQFEDGRRSVQITDASVGNVISVNKDYVKSWSDKAVGQTVLLSLIDAATLVVPPLSGDGTYPRAESSE